LIAVLSLIVPAALVAKELGLPNLGIRIFL